MARVMVTYQRTCSRPHLWTALHKAGSLVMRRWILWFGSIWRPPSVLGSQMIPHFGVLIIKSEGLFQSKGLWKPTDSSYSPHATGVYWASLRCWGDVLTDSREYMSSFDPPRIFGWGKILQTCILTRTQRVKGTNGGEGRSDQAIISTDSSLSCF